MLHSSTELTQATSAKWVIKVGKEAYEADQAMIDLIKEADKSGHRGMIHFKNFSISIPHIQSMHKAKIVPKLWNEVDPRELTLPELTQEQRDINRQKIQEMKSKLLEKYQPK